METILYLVYRRIVLIGGALLLSGSYVSGQYCDSITPSFIVDLSPSPYMTWLSPVTQRDGFCCGATAPDQCLEFIITLHPDAAAIMFNIASGAVPPGALFYQIDCGPPTPVGSPICLSGAGPFHLTFCKPGNNSNSFSIETIPNPTFGPDLTLSNGCSGILYANFYDETTVSWNSVSPNAPGTYNSYLNCTLGCDTVSVSGQPAAPVLVDYLVCGMAANGCIPDPVCDTISVNFIPPVMVTIDAPDTVLCYDETSLPVTALVSGGIAPYTFLWDTGETTAGIMAGSGMHTVTVGDASGCMITQTSVNVTQVLPPSVNAGGDVDLCAGFMGGVTLNGTAMNTSGVIWTGGSGTFSDNTVLNPDYTPSPTEIANGYVLLTLISDDVSGCPPVSDDMSILYNYVGETAALVTTDLTCFGANDGTVGITVNGPNGPYSFSFDGGATTTTATDTGLAPGSHTITVFNVLGCDSTLTYDIISPPLLVLNAAGQQDVSCAAGNNGQAQVTATGGTPSYQFSWDTTPAQSGSGATGLAAGTYTATVTDQNGCTATLPLTITEPLPLEVNLSAVPPSCFGLNNGAVSATVSGGTGNYGYLWGGGQTSTTVYSIVAGNYSVTVTDANGCTIADQITVTQPPQLVAAISPDTLVCPGTQLPLSVNASGGTGTYAYNWIPSGQTTATATMLIQADQEFSCTVTDNNGCSVALDVSVTVETMDPDDISASASPTAICLGDSSVLTAVYSGNDPTVTLTWQQCAACPAQITVSPAVPTSYTVVAENYCGQTISASVQLMVNLPPQITLDPDPHALCPHESMSFFSGTSNPQWDYTWDFGDGQTSSQATPSHAYASAGEFPVSVTVTDANGCTTTAANGMLITVNPQAVAQFSASSTTESMLDPEFEFYNSSQDAATYLWNFGDGTMSTQFNTQHTYAAFGNYLVTLFANNSYDCPDSTELMIVVNPSFEIYIPNAFTPDDDQYNQTFGVDGYGLIEEGFTLEIYNRWGEVIFRTTDIHQGWDGTYKGSETVQDGVYTWIVYFKDLTNETHRREGHVSLLK